MTAICRRPNLDWFRQPSILGAWAVAAVAGFVAAPAHGAGACMEGETLRFGFYAYFSPLSYAADEDPQQPGFNQHLGYEADLVTALEALDDAGLTFTRHGIVPWPGIWLRSVSEFDVVGGGITILETRTRNDAGETVVRFTNGHVAFRQSLLVRSEDAARLPTHAALDSNVRVGVLAGTTGEARLLELTGLVDDAGHLAAGTRVTTAAGEVVADGSAAYRITSAGATANLNGRQRLYPPDANRPQVIYLGDVGGEQELLDALDTGAIDAVARGEIGNRDATAESGGRYAVTAIDPQAEHGGFTVNAGNTDLLACLNERIPWLTAGGAIGYGQWRDDASVFMQRATLWNGLLRDLEGGGAVLDLATLFSTPSDGAQLTAESSDPDLVRVDVDDGKLAIAVDQGLALVGLAVVFGGEGTATITLTATQDGGTTVLRFDITVTPSVRVFFRGWRLLLGSEGA